MSTIPRKAENDRMLETNIDDLVIVDFADEGSDVCSDLCKMNTTINDASTHFKLRKSDLDNAIAESVGSFATIKDSIQALLEKLKLTKIESPVKGFGFNDTCIDNITEFSHNTNVKRSQEVVILKESPNVLANYEVPWWSSESSSEWDSDLDWNEPRFGSDCHHDYINRLIGSDANVSDDDSMSDNGGSVCNGRSQANSKVSCCNGGVPCDSKGFEKPNVISRSSCLSGQKNFSWWSSRRHPFNQKHCKCDCGHCPHFKCLIGQVQLPPVTQRCWRDGGSQSSSGVSSSKISKSVVACDCSHPKHAKYKARDVLMGKGQLKLALYINCGLLTIHVEKGKRLQSRKTEFCNSYVKIEIIPKHWRKPSCRTMPTKKTNQPFFDQKFSLQVLCMVSRSDFQYLCTYIYQISDFFAFLLLK